MGVWKAKIVPSKRSEINEFETEISKLLNLGWTLKGYSVSERYYHFALLVKELKQKE